MLKSYQIEILREAVETMYLHPSLRTILIEILADDAKEKAHKLWESAAKDQHHPPELTKV